MARDGAERNRASLRVARAVVLVCALFLLTVGVCVEIGWATGNPYLKSIIPGLVGMNPTTAALFIASAAVLFDSYRRVLRPTPLVWPVALTMIVVGAIKLAGYVQGVDLPIDRLIFPIALDPNGPFHGNALAPNTAVAFILMGLALPAAVHRVRRALNWVQTAVLLTMAVGFMAIVGYVFSAFVFYGVGRLAPMALHTALCFGALGLGMLSLSHDRGAFALFIERRQGSVMLRQVLPLAVVMPVVVGILRVRLVQMGAVDVQTAAGLSAVVNVSLMALVLVSTAAVLNAADRRREAADAKLRKVALRAEEASQAKSEFLANMSHEIRTPLNGIVGMLRMIERGDLTPDQRACTDVIRQSADTLLSIINDVIDVSKIEAGKMTLERVPFDPKDIVSDVSRLFFNAAEQKSLDLHVDLPWGVPCTVIGDPTRFRQVATNLVSNAVKFTKEGSIRLVLEVDSSAVEHALTLTVQDTGVGIPPDRLEQIFESFTQADGSTTRRFGGSGLGLTISKHLIEQMGGSLTVLSEVGTGSVFCVRMTLPAVPVENTALFGGVCIVSASASTREALARIVRPAASWVVLARDLAAMSAGARPDVVFVDSEWTDRVTAGRVIAIAPLGFVTSTDRRISLPLKESEVLAELSPTVPTVEAATEPRLSGTHVLVVEDNEVNQMVIASMLEELGVESLTANHGGEVLDILDRQRVDLILMDCHMPEMDGFEATRLVRRLPGSASRLPILALTASALEQDRLRCLEAGMDGFVTKPVDPTALRKAIEEALAAHQTRRAG